MGHWKKPLKVKDLGSTSLYKLTQEIILSEYSILTKFDRLIIHCCVGHLCSGFGALPLWILCINRSGEKTDLSRIILCTRHFKSLDSVVLIWSNLRARA